MALIRVSAVKGAIHGIQPNGQFAFEPYSRRSRLGKTEEFREPEAPAGGFGPINPGELVTNPRELDARGFPRLTSLLTHMMQNQINPAIEDLGDQPFAISGRLGVASGDIGLCEAEKRQNVA